jgi:WD40 repeat protein
VFSADGASLVSAGEGGHIRVWDMDGNEKLAAPARPGRVLSLAFCGPEHVAAGGSDNVIRILDVATGREAYRLIGHSGSIASLVYNDSMGLLVSGSYDTTARLWSVPPRAAEETALRPGTAEKDH